MTQVLQIPTPFADLSELTENFAQRVDEERLMLPHLEPMPEGEWVQFTVLLGDGNVALAGVGRVQGSFDNGEEHPPEYRYDVVLDSLQFEGMHEVMFERLLMARASLAGGEPVTGEVSVEELERAAAVQPAPAASEPEEPAWQDDAQDWQAQAAADEPSEPEPQDSGTGEVDVGELAEVASYGDHAAEPTPTPARASQRPPAAPSQRPPAKRPPTAPYPTRAREPGKLPSPHSFEGRALTRPSLEPVWTPTPAERPDAAQSSGYFDYQGGVPRPAHPPRPEIDASQRVVPAPRPGAPWARAQATVAAAAAAVAMSVGEPAEAAFEEEEEEEVSAQVELPDGEREEW
ncbi:hypothetical protein [Sandaracinus amylolyticus]|uniref:Uncharacterized protein n=1 Tax=Sandaracinus amylolyticus TaxID=927083 RepID=A0A0F6SDE2_9BACT|nr:hypothetical protein [Sandaracinus amylolyticus]AKF03289.1 hypothetical protein DB32_000438 [Sandaracinus amylolyticus]